MLGGTPKVTPQWLWPSKPSKYRQEPHVRFWWASRRTSGERWQGPLLRARRLHYLGTMTDNAAGTHSKVIGSSPSSSPSVWTHTVPGADTVARRACR